MKDFWGLILNPILFFALIGLIATWKKKDNNNTSSSTGGRMIKTILIIAIILYFISRIFGLMMHQVGADDY